MMTFKLTKIFYFVLLIYISLGNQKTSLLTEKIILENSLRDKVISAVSKLLGENNFLTIVNVEYSTVGGTLKKTVPSKSGENLSNGYSPFPGLPTVPSREGPSSSNQTSTSSLMGANYSIGRIEVNIDVDEKLANFEIKENIKALVKKAIPEIKDCDECIRIGLLQFLPNEKSTLEKQLKSLEEQVSALQQNNERLEDEKRKTYLKELENNYNEVKEILSTVQKREDTRLQRKKDADSLLIVDAIEEDKRRRQQLIDDKNTTDERLEKMMDSKIRSDSVIISEAMDMYKSIMKKKGGEDFDDDAFLGMQIGNSSGGGILIFFLFLLIIICIITFFYFTLKKTGAPIYLKQKIKNGSSEQDSATKNGNIDNTSTANTEPSSPTLKRDEDAIRSELRSLQQTAVSLTVGEKESASALIKEWLEDNPKQDDNSAEE